MKKIITDETIHFIEISDPETIKNFRETYLDSLPLAQEYYLEIQIKMTVFYLVHDGARSAGYFILSPENVLLEYYLLPEWVNRLDEIFGQILREFPVESAVQIF